MLHQSVQRLSGERRLAQVRRLMTACSFPFSVFHVQPRNAAISVSSNLTQDTEAHLICHFTSWPKHLPLSLCAAARVSWFPEESSTCGVRSWAGYLL